MVLPKEFREEGGCVEEGEVEKKMRRGKERRSEREKERESKGAREREGA